MRKRIEKCKSFVSVAVAMVFVFLSVICSASARAADFEVILGTSSGFNVVRGTNVASGTSTFYIGSSTVSVGTTTQGGILRVAGTSTASTADFEVLTSGGTHSFFINSNNGYIGVGTNTPSKSLHIVGTMTLGSSNQFIVDENGSVTAAFFTGDGSRLTSIATAVNGVSITPSTITTGSTTVSTFTATGSATVGTAEQFKVDESGNVTTNGTFVAGSSTVSTFTATGSATVTGTLTARTLSVGDPVGFKIDETGLVTLAAGILNAGATQVYSLESGSTTVSTLTVNGSITAYLGGSEKFKMDDTGTVTLSTGSLILEDGTITVGGDKFVVWNTGSVTAASFTGDGSRLTNIATAVNGASITPSTISTGSTTVSTFKATGSATVMGTLTVGSGFTVGASGSTTVSTFTSTGAATLSNTLSVAGATTLSTLTSGSSTVSDLQVNGSLTVTGSITAAGGKFVVDGTTGSMTAAGGNFVVGANGSVTATYLDLGSTGTLSAGYIKLTNGTITVGGDKFVVWNTGSVTAAGTITAAYFSGNGAGLTSLTFSGSDINPTTITTGSTTVSTFKATGSATVMGTLTVGSGFTVGASGSTTVSTFTSTGAATLSNTLSVAGATTLSTLTSGSSTVSTLTVNGSITAYNNSGVPTFWVDNSTGSSTVSDLQVNGSLTVTGSITAAGGAFIVKSSGTTTTITSTTAGIAALLVQNTNVDDTGTAMVVKLGTTTPAGRTYIEFRKSDDFVTGKIEANADTTVAYTLSSDRRRKENIKTTHYGLNELLSIKVCDYNFIGSSVNSTGFIAQELYEVYPLAVSVGGDDPKTDPWTVDYSKLTPLITKAVQEQQIQIEELKVENGELGNQILKLRERLAENELIKKELRQVKEMINSISNGAFSQNLQLINARNAMSERKDGFNPDRVSNPVRVGFSAVGEKVEDRSDWQLIELSHSEGTTRKYVDPLWAEWEVEGVQ